MLNTALEYLSVRRPAVEIVGVVTEMAQHGMFFAKMFAVSTLESDTVSLDVGMLGHS